MLHQTAMGKRLFIVLLSLVACQTPEPLDSNPSGEDSEPEEELEVLVWDNIQYTIWFGYDPEIGIFNPTKGSGENQVIYSPKISILLRESNGKALFDQKYLTTLDPQYLDKNNQSCFATYDIVNPTLKEWNKIAIVYEEEELVHHYGFQFSDYNFASEGNCNLVLMDGTIIEDSSDIGKWILADAGVLMHPEQGSADATLPLTAAFGIGSRPLFLPPDDLSPFIGAGGLVWPTESITDDMYNASWYYFAKGVVIGEDGVVPTDTEGNIPFNLSNDLIGDNGEPVRGFYNITFTMEIVGTTSGLPGEGE